MDQCSLLCDEELLCCTPPSSPGAAASWTFQYSAAAVTSRDADDADGYLRACVRKQHSFVPRGGYVRKLRRCPELSGFRHRALRWIMAARTRLDLSIGTAFSAVNYLDRFVSLYTNMKWEAWMMELLSVACLSIAAKFDEVLVPSLHDLPVEDLDHSFDPTAIQRMELAVLRALDWTLNCVTAHSFVGPLTSLMDSAHHPHQLRRAAADRVVELLVGAAFDVELVEYKPSAVALSALRCALEEEEEHGQPALLEHYYSHCHLAVLAHVENPREHDMAQEELEECHRRLEKRVAVDPAVPINSSSSTTDHPTAAAAPAGGGGNQIILAPNAAAAPPSSPAVSTVVTAPEMIQEGAAVLDWIVDVGIVLLKNVVMGVHAVVSCEGQQLLCGDYDHQPKKKKRRRGIN